MPFAPRLRSVPTPFLVALGIATVLAAWLRIHGITQQVLIDDEWHAIHKLLGSSYGNIFATFGLADHSIPLTLMYKAMASTIGLAEGRMHALQIACGIALVPLCAWLAWRAARDAATATLFAFLVAAAPFLVMWSRFARPYAVALLLNTVCLAALWRWRAVRSVRLGALVAITAALSTWFLPIAGFFPVFGCLFVFFEDAMAPARIAPRPSRASFALGVAVIFATLVLIGVPLRRDWQSLKLKSGGDQPGLDTFDRMFAIFWGGIPTPLVVVACAFAIWGLIAVYRRDRALGAFLLVLGFFPGAMLTLLGAYWVQHGQNFARYVVTLQPIVLFLGAHGVVSLARILSGRWEQQAAWGAAAAISAWYLYATPTIMQVVTLGPWYAHQDYHWDYRYRWNVAKRNEPIYAPPAFYRQLAAMPPGSAPIIEAPYEWQAPFNPIDVYATYHHQPQRLGMLHSLCLPGPQVGEPPEHDRRFRFRMFVFLDDVDAVRQSGARYLLLHRQLPPRPPRPGIERCLEALTRLYGDPISLDEQLAVFDLHLPRS